MSGINGQSIAPFTCAITGPHRVYTILDEPKAPWEPNGIIQCPWADALELACTVAEGKSDKVQTLAAITSYLFYDMGFMYDAEEAGSSCCDKLITGEIRLAFDSYLKRSKVKVNCVDQAYGLSTFGNLMGIHSTVVTTQPMGYINTVNIVGVGVCNNPGYLGLIAPNNVAVCGMDDISRSRFKFHSYVFAESVIFDACIGPALGTQMRLAYLKSVIDSSTDAERLWSPFSPVGPPSATDFEERNYSIIGVK